MLGASQFWTFSKAEAQHLLMDWPWIQKSAISGLEGPGRRAEVKASSEEGALLLYRRDASQPQSPPILLSCPLPHHSTLRNLSLPKDRLGFCSALRGLRIGSLAQNRAFWENCVLLVPRACSCLMTRLSLLLAQPVSTKTGGQVTLGGIWSWHQVPAPHNPTQSSGLRESRSCFLCSTAKRRVTRNESRGAGETACCTSIKT